MRLIFALVALMASHQILADQERDSVGCEGPDTSSYFESCILSKSTIELDAKLNAKYQEVLENSTSNEMQPLIAAQRAWIRYRDITCNFEQQHFGGINSINAVRCQNRLTDERLRYLNNL